MLLIKKTIFLFFIIYPATYFFCLQKLHKKKQKMYRNSFPILKYLLH